MDKLYLKNILLINNKMNMNIISILLFLQLFRTYYFVELPFNYISSGNITTFEMGTTKQLFI